MVINKKTRIRRKRIAFRKGTLKLSGPYKCIKFTGSGIVGRCLLKKIDLDDIVEILMSENINATYLLNKKDRYYFFKKRKIEKDLDEFLETFGVKIKCSEN